MRASILGLVAGLLVAALAGAPLYAADPAVPLADVRAMQARIPSDESGRPVRGAYATAGDAERIAQAVSAAARSRHEAALAVLYAAWESGNDARAVGDHGRSLGAWQLQRVDPDGAFDPRRAVQIWIADADASRARCGDLTAIVSGRCGVGREKAERRERVAGEIEKEGR